MIKEIVQDCHLNVFRHYNGHDGIENNLTRALAICLQNNPLFLKEFLKELKIEVHFDYIESDEFFVDIQVRVKELPKAEDDWRSVHPVALTTAEISPTDFNDQEVKEDKDYSPITDLILAIKDQLVIFEVKRTNENCARQLKKQVQGFNGKLAPFQSMTWEKVLGAIRRTKNTYRLTGQNHLLLDDFHELLSTEYVDWLPTRPFKYIKPRKGEDNNILLSQMEKRLALSRKHLMEYEAKSRGNRHYIELDWGWANEVVGKFEKKGGNEWVLAIYLWPANTKSQGYQVFNEQVDQEWQNKKKLSVQGYGDYKIEITPEVKFSSSFGGFISKLEFSDPLKELKDLIHKRENFHKYSGKWNREGDTKNWENLEYFFDRHIHSNYEWRKKCQWEEKFIQSNRMAILISFGFEVKLEVPSKKLQQLDQNEEGYKKVADLLSKITDAFKGLIN